MAENSHTDLHYKIKYNMLNANYISELDFPYTCVCLSSTYTAKYVIMQCFWNPIHIGQNVLLDCGVKRHYPTQIQMFTWLGRKTLFYPLQNVLLGRVVKRHASTHSKMFYLTGV